MILGTEEKIMEYKKELPKEPSFKQQGLQNLYLQEN